MVTLLLMPQTVLEVGHLDDRKYGLRLSTTTARRNGRRTSPCPEEAKR